MAEVWMVLFAGMWAARGMLCKNLLRGRIMRLSYLLTTLVLLGFLSACGQKGGLYLPNKTTKQSADAVQVAY
jgi:predicted small lipoprotein YifL